jgi:hypothetical protein
VDNQATTPAKMLLTNVFGLFVPNARESKNQG